MKFSKHLFILLLFAALNGCATMTITSDYDAFANFSGLKTYAWIPDPKTPSGDPRIDSSLLDSRIRKAVEIHLSARGYVKEKSGTPDFWIGYHAAIDKKMDVEILNDYYGYGPGFGRFYGAAYAPPGTASAYVHEYEEGTLILDIVKPDTRKLIWRGTAQASLNREATSEEKRERINEAVRRILKKFPPN